MAKSESGKRTRRGEAHRRGPKQAIARTPRPDTMTLEKMKAALQETFALFGDAVAESTAAALERRRAACERGDLLALYTALELCFIDRFGMPQVSVVHDAGVRQDRVEAPLWAFWTTMRILWRGIHGVWPKGPRPRGRHSTAARKHLDDRVHLDRARRVLAARSAGVAWEDVFRTVAEQILAERGERVTSRAVEESYLRIAKAFRSPEGLSAFLFQPRIAVPQDWGP